MSHYFIFRNNKVSEPIGVEELQRMAASGEISKQHMISIDGGDWIAAREFRGLFPEAAVETKSSPKIPSPLRQSSPQSPTAPLDEYLPISNGGLNTLSRVVFYAGGISYFATRRFYETKPELFDISLWAIIILSLLFFGLYFRALYRCWKLVHLFGDTRWPSPGWVLWNDIGSFLLWLIFWFTSDSPIATILKVISMISTHIWLGIRIKNIFTRFDAVDGDSPSSNTTIDAFLLIILYIIFELVDLYIYPTLSDIQSTRVDYFMIAFIVSFSNKFIQSAVAGANYCLHLATSPATVGNTENLHSH